MSDLQRPTLKLLPLADGGEPLVFEWPLIKTKHYDAAAEIIETIESVMDQCRELNVVLNKLIKIKEVDTTSYEAMFGLCDKYNKAAKTIQGLRKGIASQSGPRGSASATISEDPVLRKIINRSYNRAVEDPAKLNHHYEAFSSETYGETTFHRCQKIIDELAVKPTDVIVDLGSGVGQVVVHMAAASGCKKVVGIELADVPAACAKMMQIEFERWMKWHGKKFAPFQLLHGDFMHPAHRDLITKEATIIFINNYAFRPELNNRIKTELLEGLDHGTRIVSTKAFCQVGERRVTARHMNDLAAILRVKTMMPVPEPTSWTCNNVEYYLHTVNREKLEHYYSKLQARNSSRSNTASPDMADAASASGAPMAGLSVAASSSAQPSASVSVSGERAMSQSVSKKHSHKPLSASQELLQRLAAQQGRAERSSTSASGTSSDKSGRKSSSSRESSEKPTRKLAKSGSGSESKHRKLSSTTSASGVDSRQQQQQSAASSATGGGGGGSGSASYGPTTRRQWNSWVDAQQQVKHDKQKQKKPHRDKSEAKAAVRRDQEPVGAAASSTTNTQHGLKNIIKRRAHEDASVQQQCSAPLQSTSLVGSTLTVSIKKEKSPSPAKEKSVKKEEKKKHHHHHKNAEEKEQRREHKERKHAEKERKLKEQQERDGKEAMLKLKSTPSTTGASSPLSPTNSSLGGSPRYALSQHIIAKHHQQQQQALQQQQQQQQQQQVVATKPLTPRKQVQQETLAGLDALHEMTLKLASAPVVPSGRDVHVSELSALQLQSPVPSQSHTHSQPQAQQQPSAFNQAQLTMGGALPTNLLMSPHAPVVHPRPTSAALSERQALQNKYKEDIEHCYSDKYPQLNTYLASIKKQYEKVMDDMRDSNSFGQHIRQSMDAERARQEALQGREEHLQRQVRQLQDEGVRLLKERLYELNIVAEAPSDLMHQSKEIVLKHKELRSKYASLEYEVDVLTTKNKRLSRERDEQAIRSGIMQQVGLPMTDPSSIDSARDYLVNEISNHLTRHHQLLSDVVRMEEEVTALQSTALAGANSTTAATGTTQYTPRGTDTAAHAGVKRKHKGAGQQSAVRSVGVGRPHKTAKLDKTAVSSTTNTDDHTKHNASAAPAGGSGDMLLLAAAGELHSAQQQQQQQSVVTSSSGSTGAERMAWAAGADTEQVIGAGTGAPEPEQSAEDIEKHIAVSEQLMSAMFCEIDREPSNLAELIVAKALSVDSAAKEKEKEKKQKVAEKRNKRLMQQQQAQHASQQQSTSQQPANEHSGTMTLSSAGLVPVSTVYVQRETPGTDESSSWAQQQQTVNQVAQGGAAPVTCTASSTQHQSPDKHEPVDSGDEGSEADGDADDDGDVSDTVTETDRERLLSGGSAETESAPSHSPMDALHLEIDDEAVQELALELDQHRPDDSENASDDNQDESLLTSPVSGSGAGADTKTGALVDRFLREDSDTQFSTSSLPVAPSAAERVPGKAQQEGVSSAVQAMGAGLGVWSEQPRPASMPPTPQQGANARGFSVSELTKQ